MHYIRTPSVFMRKAPHAEVVSEALFAEEVLVLETLQGWHLIQTPDKYQGWIPKEHVVERAVYSCDLEVQTLKAHLYLQPDVQGGPFLSLPFSAKLTLLKEMDERWLQVLLPDETRAFIQRGDVVPEPLDLISFSKKFLGLPYTWGGRSSFGFDCSGFIQMLYSRLGVLLPRDARQQVLCGTPTAQLSLGDLLFWGTAENDIRHVGMFLENHTFIHTSSRENKPYLRISSLKDPEWNGQGAYPYILEKSCNQKTDGEILSAQKKEFHR